MQGKETVKSLVKGNNPEELNNPVHIESNQPTAGVKPIKRLINSETETNLSGKP